MSDVIWIEQVGTQSMPDEIVHVRTSCPTCADDLIGGKCLNIGQCSDADRSASPRDRSAASSVVPRAWTVSGRVD